MQVGCALVFPFFLESCHDALEAQGSDIALYERFSQACTRQDTTALVEYAIDLVAQGCLVELDGRRRLAGLEYLEEHDALSLVPDNSRRLQMVENSPRRLKRLSPAGVGENGKTACVFR